MTVWVCTYILRFLIVPELCDSTTDCLLKETFFEKKHGGGKTPDSAEEKERKENEGNKLLIKLVELLRKPGALKARVSSKQGGIVSSSVS